MISDINSQKTEKGIPFSHFPKRYLEEVRRREIPWRREEIEVAAVEERRSKSSDGDRRCCCWRRSTLLLEEMMLLRLEIDGGEMIDGER
ncbi:hypothetical protein L6452_25821 [Arctium lappa]|uniref:Uncharacterized protein n=1 Tax=Arctium lappa TaxID=4217 RepID=A0ACB9AC07_ARCLA|nr:hypothetical protein L6452_25821 [Arctium lappa]